jgi:hypothetical protein
MTGSRRMIAHPTYVFIDHHDGFRVTGEYDTVRVRLHPTYWSLERAESSFSIPLYAFGLVLANLCIDLCASRYDRCRALLHLDDGDRAKSEARWAYKRAMRRAPKLLRREVYCRLRPLLTRVDPLVLALHRANSASITEVMSEGGFSEEYISTFPVPDLFWDTYVRHDIRTLPAAAIAAGCLGSLVDGWLRRVVPDLANVPASTLDDLVTRKTIAGRHPLFASEAGIGLLRRWMSGHSLDLSVVFTEVMRYWRDLFSNSGVSYRSLDRTLTNLPEDVPDFLLRHLTQIRLRRPVTDRLELLVTTLVAREYDSRSSDRPPVDGNADVFLDARHYQIVRAMSHVGGYFGENLRPTCDGHVQSFVRFVLDFPNAHQGSIVGLADKSIDWHREKLEQERSEILVTLGASTPSASPPIALPIVPGIRFLANVGEFVAEGASMSNCVARYAAAAVRGQVYLFHVEHDREQATVMVNDSGEVEQARGPKNTSNRAVRWGTEMLAAWAAKISPSGARR